MTISSNWPITINESAGAALVTAACKEIAYLRQFGQSILPQRRERRRGYRYQQQLPSSQIQNLERYSSLASSFIPRDSTLSRFCIPHPDLQHNIIVSRSPDSGCQVVGLIDWQHASILPILLLVGVP